jgi:hypothetical protein
MQTYSGNIAKWLVVVGATLFIVAFFHGVAYGQNDNWKTTTGVWSVGSNWSTGSPPTSSQNAVITDAGGAVSEDSSPTIQNLTLGSGDSLVINSHTALTINGSSISNSGSFSINGGELTTVLMIGNANTTLSGTGTLTLINSPNNLILGSVGSDKLTNQSTIQGAGNVGDGQMTLANSGTIDANAGSGQNALTIQTSGGTTNTGTLEATNSSTLVLTGANITNTGGTIQAVGNGAAVNLGSGITITGGTLTSTGTGLIQTLGLETATLSGLTISSGSLVQVNDRAVLSLVGTITNNGTLSMGGGFNTTELLINGNVTLQGSGTLTLSNSPNNGILGTTSAAILTNNSIIKGAGNIGSAGMGLVNGKTGFILANAGAGQNVLDIQPDTQNFTNNGTLEAINGSVLDIITTNGSFTNFSSTTSTLTGGTYKAINGIIEFPAGNNGIVTDAANITLSGASAEIFNTTNNTNALTNLNTIATGGSFTINSGANFTTAGNFTNNGTLSIGSGTKFEVNLAHTLTNFNSTTHTLTGGTYNVTGTLQFNNASIVTNAAKITLAGTTSQIINQSNANALAGFATNNGSFTLAGNRSLTTAGNFTNAGTFTINTGSTLSVGGPGAFTQSGGKATDNGTLSASGGVKLNAGSLFGTGSITGALTSSSSGTITPGTSSTVTGILKDMGTYTQNSGALDISIKGATAGTQYDQFNPTKAALSGKLNISRPTGFIPTIGSTFKIMNFGSETGTFGMVNGQAINSTEHFTVTYQPTDVLLTVVSGAMATSQPAFGVSTMPASNVAVVEPGISDDGRSSHLLFTATGSIRPMGALELNTQSTVPEAGSTLVLLLMALAACGLFRCHSRESFDQSSKKDLL